MDFKRIILFTVFAFMVLFGWNYWLQRYHPDWAQQSPASGQTAAAQTPPADRSFKLDQGQSIDVVTDNFHASIDTAGGDLRQLDLLKQLTTGTNRPFPLMSASPAHTMILQTGLLGTGLPTHHAVFQAAATHYQLAPGQNQLDVVLTWHGPQGVDVEKVYTFHRNSYVIDLSYRIVNHGAQPVNASAYFQLLRDNAKPEGEPKFSRAWYGAAVYSSAAKYRKVSFEDAQKNKADYPRQASDGWVAMVQHYFLAALLPKQGTARENYVRPVTARLMAAGVILPVPAVAPGSQTAVSLPVYAGPEQQDVLRALAPGLERTVDYGWLTVVCVPIFTGLSWLHGLLGNWGFAIIVFTVLLKLVFFPLSASSYQSMAKMRLLQPRMQRLKEQYGDDRAKLNQAMMEFYREEKVNPLGGCLPMVIQIPVFLAFYWVLNGSVEMRHTPFILWIHDLAAPDPFYVLPVLMAVTMYAQVKLNPRPVDPMQARMSVMMPVAFSVFFFFAPSGLVLYYLVNNLLSIGQQWLITRKLAAGKAAHGKK